jgi:ABC-type multidrug transport system fused ATPase/permease subunit
MINGTIAYSGQKPATMHGTVRDNILMFKSFSKRRFKEALHYSGLTKDMSLLVKGDLTEIGEGGANLSGGQKVRVDLARALYSDRDIILLDDILSAVDVNVGAFLLK